jgi:hypothetical protein
MNQLETQYAEQLGGLVIKHNTSNEPAVLLSSRSS